MAVALAEPRSTGAAPDLLLAEPRDVTLPVPELANYAAPLPNQGCVDR